MGADMRRLITFPCAGETLAATLDAGTAAGDTGILIVSGGNELRIGAHRGMAELAARLAAAGMPVLRFDRRGIGDSTGDNGGWESSAADIAAAAAAFRNATEVTRIVGFGNCDAATALALFGGVDALVLANPWLGDGADALPPAAAIRSRYAERLRDPRALFRLVTGGVSIAKLARGLRKVVATPSQSPLAERMAQALTAFPGPVTLLLASRDNTAIGFRAAWQGAAFAQLRGRIALHEHDTASHSFQHPADKDWLFGRLREAAYSAA